MPLLPIALAAAAAFAAGAAVAETGEAGLRPWRVTGGQAYENLEIFLVHGATPATGAVPLTLAEALAHKLARVRETGNVNHLSVENLSPDRSIYVEAGDIVKGGQQDRLLTVDLILAPGSGPVPVAAFCVEQGRWRQRGQENVDSFGSAEAVAPGKAMKLITRQAGFDDSAAKPAAAAQAQVWREVAGTMDKLGTRLGAPVAAAESRSSLQLALENKALRQRVARYVAALGTAIDGHPDAIGVAYAVNGRLTGAELYGSPQLFAKRWLKLLESAATEAVGERQEGHPPAVALAAVERFLAEADGAQAAERLVGGRTRWVKRETAAVLMLESRADDSGFVHRSYLAR